MALPQRKRPRSSSKPILEKKEDIVDVWGSSNEKVEAQEKVVTLKAGSKKARTTPLHAKPVACHPGLSYNPITSDHQDIVGLAVAVELRRNEANATKDPLWSSARQAAAARPAITSEVRRTFCAPLA